MRQNHLKINSSSVTKNLLRQQQKSFSTKQSSSSSSSSSWIWWSKVTQPLTAFGSWYCYHLDHSPLLTKALTSGLISASGDLFCQFMMMMNTNTTTSDEDDKATTTVSNDDSTTTVVIVAGNQQWDVLRTLRFGLLGTIVVAPIVHVWYGWLARVVPNSVTIRVALDQIVMAPPFVAIWLTSLWTLEELTPLSSSNTTATNKTQSQSSVSLFLNSLPLRIYNDLPDIVVANWVLWVPAQFLNFAFISLRFQVLFSNVVALLWNAYLSFSTQQQQPTQTKTQEQQQQQQPIEPTPEL